MEHLELRNITYGFAKDFKHDPQLRASFNKLTQATYGFDMEYSYLSGYWSDNYIPYSLLLDNEIISNVSINKMEFLIGKEKKLGLQIGTVMTDTAHRNQGLNRYLMERVLKEWKQQSDFIYLFANDSVLDFYPKFNFELVEQYQCSKALDISTKSSSLKKLNMADDQDKKLLEQTIDDSIPMAKLSMRNNAALIMFSCMTFKQNSIYYLENLLTIILADIEGETLYLHDVFSKGPVDLNNVIKLIADNTVKRVVLGFTPLDETGYERSLLKPDDTLFVLKDQVDFFKNKKWMFPVLSHA
ncbi:GNAT family N-acetyltransferase [Muricauda sp. JGD-17]|uniref:GNAT family N-acetyltransferase n=1 Tax=Flagellimonas ochracea TaxID=2696472 RepID=A0A964TBC2_9FLAO|nr:GNAT family N-acetyltransferase [Allomuricauda ochracea]NAY91725.1 GNAT family N-acetyltransferase [Allomuricauda ochracea]